MRPPLPRPVSSGSGAPSLYNCDMSTPAHSLPSTPDGFSNPSAEDIRALLLRLRVIAVIGFSPRPARPSNNLSRQMNNTNKAAANKLRTAAAYMKRAGVAAAQAKLAYSLVNIGKGLETMAGLNNVPKTPSV